MIAARIYPGDEYTKISDCFLGVAFFSTPHRGSNLEDILKAILKLNFSSGQFEGDLSSTVRKLNLLNDSFRHRMTTLRLISFWESTETRSVNVFVASITSSDYLLGCCA